jgi:WhiB family redox-sensing transcriptional regulator
MTVTELLKPDQPVEDTELSTVGAFTADDNEWEELAACRTEPQATEVFFSEELADIVEAKRICAGCPVIAPCLEGAIARAEPCGVWGGQLFSNGRILTQKRRRGRPPKVARPEDQLPVVPVPAHLQKLIA